MVNRNQDVVRNPCLDWTIMICKRTQQGSNPMTNRVRTQFSNFVVKNERRLACTPKYVDHVLVFDILGSPVSQ